VVFGATVSGRDWSVGSVEQEVGLYINTLPVSIGVARDSDLGDWLSALQAGHSKGREQYSHVSLSMIQEAMGVSEALFDSLIVFENHPMDKDTFNQSSLQAENFQTKEYTNYALTIAVSHTGDRLHFKLDYNKEAFPREYIDMIIRHLQNVLQSISNGAKKVGELKHMTEENQNVLLPKNEFSLEADTSLELYLEAIFNRYKDKEALRDVDGQSMSYTALWNQSGKVSAYLSSHYGLKQGDTVVLYSDRSMEMVVLFLALARLGCVYVPVDKIHPEERLAYIAKDSNSRLLIVESDTAINIENTQVARLSAVIEASSEVEEVQTAKETIPLDATLYIIYTSGSTGKPKGVCVSHGNLLGYLKGIEDEFGANRVQPVLSSHGFDIFFFELLSPLLKGGTSILLRNEEVRDMETLESALQESTSFHAVPALMRAVLDHIAQTNTKEAYAKMTELYVGGDVVPNALLHQMQSLFPQAKIYVFYGPTEGTIFVTSKLYEPGSEISDRLALGTSLRSSQVLVLDRWGDLVAPGVKGELCIGGVQVSKGYLHNEALTNEKYTNNPYGAGKLYRTGDVARWDANGNIEYLGREDSQIKLRGYRIELGEINRQLEKHPNIIEAVVLVVIINDIERLIAFVKASTSETISTEELVNHLRLSLPDYMIPRHYVSLEAFPLTANNKVDKQALKEMEFEEVNSYEPPSNKIEETLISFWSELLKIDEDVIGVTENFFMLGGDSIKVITLQNKIKQEFDVKIKLETFFEVPVIRELAKVILVAEVSSTPEEGTQGEAKMTI
ncbi:amino acid adenylation domain-containing protein, partial [Kordia periserrulae]